MPSPVLSRLRALARGLSPPQDDDVWPVQADEPRASTSELAAHLVVLAGLAALLLMSSQVLLVTAVTAVALAGAAVRLPPRLAVAELLVLATIAIVATTLGQGVFPASAPVSASTALLVYVLAIAALLLPLNAAITLGRRASARARWNVRLYRRGFEESLQGELLLTLLGNELMVERANAAAREMLIEDPHGQEPKEQLSIALAHAFGSDQMHSLLLACQAMAVGDGTGWQAEFRVDGPEGSKWYEVAVSLIGARHPPDTTATPRVSACFSAQLVDTTQRHEVGQRVTQLALRDGLTGLVNRTLLADRLRQLLRVAEREGGLVGVLLIDLDEFALANITHGHAVGDALLVQVAHRLVEAVRPGDTVARLGGDEFVVVCPDLPDAETAWELADRLAAGMNQPLDVDGDLHTASVSIGVAVGDGSSSPDSLLRDADSAMYASKFKHRRTTLFADEHRWRAQRTVQLERALVRAVQNSELLLHVQPIVNLTSGQIVAGETLVRWQHPERGLLLPGEWLDVAEASPMVHDIGRWVLRDSCRLARQWRQSLRTDVPAVHVNVSARQLERGDLCDYVLALLDEFDLPGHALVLELTETQLCHLDRAVSSDLTELAQRGVVLAADDFGTGYSPLTQITDLPLEMVKIDRTFVSGLGTDSRASAVVRAVVGLGRALGLQVVAEGVESPAQAQLLRESDCTLGQGYLWSPPRPAESFLTQVRAQRRHVSAHLPQMVRPAAHEG